MLLFFFCIKNRIVEHKKFLSIFFFFFNLTNPRFLNNSYLRYIFLLVGRKKVMQVRNDMRVSKWWLNLYLWLNYSFKLCTSLTFLRVKVIWEAQLMMPQCCAADICSSNSKCTEWQFLNCCPLTAGETPFIPSTGSFSLEYDRRMGANREKDQIDTGSTTEWNVTGDINTALILILFLSSLYWCWIITSLLYRRSLMERDSCLCFFSHLWRLVAYSFTACVTNCICKLCAALPLTEPVLHRCLGLQVIHTDGCDIFPSNLWWDVHIHSHSIVRG